jgi:hypothetical protein
MSTHDDYTPDDFPPDLKAFEAALGGLVPAESRLNRDRLMYLAGAAAATPSGNQPALRIGRIPALLWPIATAALFVIAVGLGALAALRQPAERIVYVDRPAARANSADAPSLLAQLPRVGPSTAADRDTTSGSYLALREQVLRLGVGALDVPSGAAEPPDRSDVRNRSLLNHLLGS